VLDGLYSWSEYKILKDEFPSSFQVIHVYSPPAVRYRRLAERSETENDPARTVRTLTAEAARKRDYAEIEGIEKGGPIAMADYVIDNQRGLEDLGKRVLAIAEGSFGEDS
jgi:dephospho-CoA kinase